MGGRYRKFSHRLYSGSLGRKMRKDAVATPQALAPYLIGCEHGNMIGLYRLPVAYIAADLGWPLEGASKALRRLSEWGFVRVDEGAERVWVVDAFRHEFAKDRKSEKDNNAQAIAAILEEAGNSFLVNDFLEMYGAEYPNLLCLCEAPSKGLARGFEGAPARVPDQEQDPEQEQDSFCAERGEDAAAAPAVNLGEPVAWMPYTGPDPTKRAHRPVEGVDEDGRRELAVYALDVETLAKAYPGVNMETELQAARAWLVTHKSRRKTAGGMTAYLRTWMQKAQNGSSQVPAREKPRGRFSQPHTLNRGDLDKLIDF